MADLLADIGGTNARFARAGADGRPEAIVSLAVGAFARIDDAIAHYLGLTRATHPPPARAALAIAGPIAGDEVALTNATWSFSRAALQASLRLERLLVLNDFTALAWSLPALRADELRPVGAGRALADAAIGLIGPGTGLGVSGLVPGPGGWAAIQGEGGHASLSPADAREAAILAVAWRTHAHVSFERLVSGTGLPLLHAAVAEVDGFASRADDATASAARITTEALAGEAHAIATLDTFCALLGGAAGNLALTLGARGGVYVGGGIVPRLDGFLERSPFRARFEAKGRAGAWLADVPTTVILADNPALLGAAHALRQGRAAVSPI